MSRRPELDRQSADSRRSRYARAKEIFLASSEVSPRERATFVSSECSGDSELLSLVEELIANDEAIAKDDASSDLPALVERPTIPQRIGRFHVLRVLGRGGMGTVYLAEEREPIRRRVAIKVIHAGLESSEVLTRFEGERQALALLDHPNVAKVIDAGTTDDGRPFLVLEYVDGEPITHYCDRHRLSILERVALFEQVCRGVHHAGERGIVHRDLKPSNILVSEIDGSPHARIIDFGIAKATNLRLTEHTLYTELGRIVGTPQYMSPEQAALSSEDLDTRSDVYSLGVVLYELIVGSLPLEWDSIEELSFDEVRRRIREDDPSAPRSLWQLWNETKRQRRAEVRSTTIDDLPGELESGIRWIAVKALEKDPDRRYATAGELADDLRSYREGEKQPAAPPSRSYLLLRQVRRHRALVAGALAVFATLIIGLISTTWFALESARNESTARETAAELDRQLQEVLRLADTRRLSTYREKAEALVPARSDLVAELETWVREAQELVGRLPEHRASLERLRTRARLEDGKVTFDDPETLWQYETLERLVADLERFADPKPRVGTCARVERRLDFARTVRHKTIESPEAASSWREAIEAIRDLDEHPAYGGLEITPQEGLLPIGPDLDSGLWEFAVVETGEVPTRRDDGALSIDESMAVILVLVPGGTFDMGARRPDAQHPAGSPNVYERAIKNERPVHRVELGPYFLAKFEMTQAQWQRLTGDNPSVHKPGRRFGDKVHTALHPVEGVSWEMCLRTLGELGLAIPTEAQWEHAARAGTVTPWSTGADKLSLEGHANIADQFSKENGGSPGFDFAPWNDGYTTHAPVGSYKPNGFGLYDVHGNVWEWCRERLISYDQTTRAGDGERSGEGSANRISRGGSFHDSAPYARSTMRGHYAADGRDATLGIRPSRELDSDMKS